MLSMKRLLICICFLISSSSFANWKLEKVFDDFEETTRYIIFSDRVKPNKPMSFPNEKAFAYLYYECVTNSITMRVSANNLVNDDYGYDSNRRININVKLDGKVFKGVTAYQDFMSDYISFSRSQTERKLVDSKEFIIQLNHYSDGQRTYTFDMKGLKPLMVDECSLVPMTWFQKSFGDDTYLGF